jgi:hypothetical protein
MIQEGTFHVFCLGVFVSTVYCVRINVCTGKCTLAYFNLGSVSHFRQLQKMKAK